MDALAERYHAHHSRYTEDLPFWLELAAQQGGPVLELGCGTGRVMLPLAEAGHTAFGLDTDPHMLVFLAHRGASMGFSNLHLLQADLTRFHLAARFPLVLLPCNTYSTLSEAGRQGALACLRRHLSSEGLFALSVSNPALWEQLPDRAEPELEDSFAYPDSEDLLQVSSGWQRRGDELTVFWHYDRLRPDGRIERHTVEQRYFMASLQALQDEFNAAGFHIQALYGDFDRTSYDDESPYLIFLTQRR